MAEYKSNSYKSKAEEAERKTKEEQRKASKVISGKASTKPNEVRKITNLFVSEDIDNIKSYILIDVIVPTIKDALLDSLDMLLNGGGRRNSTRGRSSSNRPSYRSYYDSDRDRRDSRPVARASTEFNYDDIVYGTRGDAERVLDKMREYVDQAGGLVTVADMYEFSGLAAPYTAVKYGWFNLRTAEVIRGRDGYYLKLPKAMPSD